MKRILITVFLLLAVKGFTQTINLPSDSTSHYHIKQWAQGANPGATALNQNSNIIDSAVWNTASRVSTIEATTINGQPITDGNLSVTLSTLVIPNTYKAGDLVQITGSPGNYSVSAMNQGEFALTRDTIPIDSGGIFTKTLTTGTTIWLGGTVQKKSFSTILTNSTLSSLLITWVAPVGYTLKWAPDADPTTITGVSGEYDVFTFIVHGTKISGSVIHNF